MLTHAQFIYFSDKKPAKFSKLYVLHIGYSYTCDPTLKNLSRWMCIHNSDRGCNATVNILDGKMVSISELKHNHQRTGYFRRPVATSTFSTIPSNSNIINALYKN